MEQQNLWEVITEQDPNYHTSPYLLSWKEYGEVTKRDVFHYVNGMARSALLIVNVQVDRRRTA